MSSLELKKLFFDIDRACALIVEFMNKKTRKEFLLDKLLQSAVERQFEIIGEAMSQAVKLNQTIEDRITNSKRIIAFRNRLIHGYATVSPRVVWDIIEHDLPALIANVKVVLNSE
jgi:uncharacterized protein with HEPN domain